jgi:DNA (cytosine-5)-methyltransferase 1
VPGIVNIQDGVVFETVCTDLESQGYEVQPFNIPASAVGAPHQRKRIWIIATHSDYTGDRASEYETNEDRQKINEGRQEQSQFESSGYSKNVENSGRTLQQGSSLREKNEDEVGKENANQHQRSSSSSESNVANTDTRLGNGENEEIQTGRNTSNISSSEMANTNSEGLEGLRQSNSQFNETSSSTSRSKERQGQVDQGWWSVEPNVGRVAHGVSGRVHRLRGLGNSIVPQIAEEIGKAIIKATERTK